MLYQGLSFILAFSSTLVHGEGDSVLRCPIPVKCEFEFIPFTASEVSVFVSKCAAGSSFNNETTLPLVVDRVLLHGYTYNEMLLKLVRDILTHLIYRLSRDDDGAANILKVTILMATCAGGNG